MGRGAAAPTAAIMANRLGWSEEMRDQSIRDYFAELHRRFVIMDAGGDIGITAFVSDILEHKPS